MANLYLSKFKADQIRKAKKDFGNNVSAFTRKLFFYYFIDDGKKYIHKDSLRAVYTNADTYSELENTLDFCLIADKPKIDVFSEILSFITTENKIIPKFEENDKFLFHKYIAGEPLTEINNYQFFFLKDADEEKDFTPFYNSMCYNLVSSEEGVMLIDMKHFERKDDKPFFVFMNNDKAKINDLYIEDDTVIDNIMNHLEKDYIIDNINIIRFNRKGESNGG